MRFEKNLFIGSLVLIAVMFLFGFALAKEPYASDPQMVSKLGVTTGWLSALCWGFSVVDPEPLPNRWFNFVAAAVAAASLGYLAPSEITFDSLLVALHIRN